MVEVQNVFIELSLAGSAFNYKHYMNEEKKKGKKTRRLKSRQEERVGLEGSEESVCSEEEGRPPMGNVSSGFGGGGWQQHLSHCVRRLLSGWTLFESR